MGGKESHPPEQGIQGVWAKPPPPSPPKKKVRKSTTIGKSSYVKNLGKLAKVQGSHRTAETHNQ
jgi:hypothetical protein